MRRAEANLIEVGDLLEGRICSAIEFHKGRKRYLMVCPLCKKEAWLITNKIKRKQGCSCRRTSKLSEAIQDKYGVCNVSQHPDVKAKKKETTLLNYGVEYPQQSSEIRERTKRTCIERYGVDSTLKTSSVREKIKDTCMVRYGNTCALQSPEIQKQIQDKRLEKYGVRYPAQRKEVVDKIMNSKDVNMLHSCHRSAAELELESCIARMGIMTCRHSSGSRELDIMIPTAAIGIEYNGCYYHSEAVKDKNYHIDKTLLYKNMGISVIHIWEYQWINRKAQVLNYLRSRLNKNTIRVGARLCSINKISNKDARYFIDAYHIQGANCNIDMAFGAYYQGNLIAVATFARHHRNNKDFTLNRLCFKYDHSCTGFLGYVVKHVYDLVKCPIITWVDRGLSEGMSYIKAGFKLDAILPPDYVYYNDRTKKIIAKQSFRKTDDRTERQRAIDEGLLRLYDCGKIRFIYDPNNEARLGGGAAAAARS